MRDATFRFMHWTDPLLISFRLDLSELIEILDQPPGVTAVAGRCHRTGSHRSIATNSVKPPDEIAQDVARTRLPDRLV